MRQIALDLLTYVLLQPAAIRNGTGTLMRTFKATAGNIDINILSSVGLKVYMIVDTVYFQICPQMAFVYIIFFNPPLPLQFAAPPSTGF